MSYNTIARSFNNENIYHAAQIHHLKMIYTIKYITYLLVTLFLGQNLIKLREIRRQEEISDLATTILKKLPNSYQELNNKEYTLYQNREKNYEIKYHNKNLYLSKITNSSIAQSIIIADISDEFKFNSLKDKLYKVELQKKYDELSSIQINGLKLIDELPNLRLQNYQQHNKINQLIKYFQAIYIDNYQYDKKPPWDEQNISLEQYAQKFKQKFDYFIKNRHNKDFDPQKHAIAGDDIYELTGYFLYKNQLLKQKLTNIKFGDPIIIDGIIDLVDLDEGIKISNMQCLHANLT
jgi:hypothetical protein